MLCALQEEVAAIIANLAEARDFALAGGAALIARGDVDRQTEDLDFFGLSPDSVDRLVPAVEGALRGAGLEVRVVRVAPGFARIGVARGSIGPRWISQPTLDSSPRNPALSSGPSRGENSQSTKSSPSSVGPRPDFVDLMAVEPDYGLDVLFELAREKDGGFLPSVFAEMVSRFDRLRREEFDIVTRPCCSPVA